jgi:hypothetical protein
LFCNLLKTGYNTVLRSQIFLKDAVDQWMNVTYERKDEKMYVYQVKTFNTAAT